MKKIIIGSCAIGAMAICQLAMAQNKAATDGLVIETENQSTRLYGLLEVTVSNVDNKNSSGDSLSAMQTPWFSGSRWGITSSRNIGGDLKAIVKLESEYVVGTGAEDTSGVLFNRDAWAGILSESFGKLTFGRQNALGRDFAASYGDPYGSAQITTEEGGFSNTNNFKHLVYYGGSATGTRMDNGIVWKKAYSSGLVLGAAYSFGTAPAASSPDVGTTLSTAAAYNAGAFNVSGFLTQAKVDSNVANAYSVGGNFTSGDVRFNVGYFRYSSSQVLPSGADLGTRNDNAYTVSMKYAPVGNWDYELGYQTMKVDNAASISGTIRNAFAPIYTTNADGSKNLASVGGNPTGTGSRNTTYASVFYHFDKSTDVYLAADVLSLDPGYGTVNKKSSQNEFALGFRTRF